MNTRFQQSRSSQEAIAEDISLCTTSPGIIPASTTEGLGGRRSTRRTTRTIPMAEEALEEPGQSLQLLFREPLRDQGPIWKDAEITVGSTAANELVFQQRANRMVICAKAILATANIIPGLVFITVVERAGISYNVICQIIEFQVASQVFVAQRMSIHAENLLFPLRATFSVSTVEVLISPTLPFLNHVLDAMGAAKEFTRKEFTAMGAVY